MGGRSRGSFCGGVLLTLDTERLRGTDHLASSPLPRLFHRRALLPRSGENATSRARARTEQLRVGGLALDHFFGASLPMYTSKRCRDASTTSNKPVVTTASR